MGKQSGFARREVMAGFAAAGFAGTSIAACVPLDTSPPGRLSARLRIIEAAGGGTLGVALRDIGGGRVLDYRSDQLFGHCSSFKLSLAALVLSLDQSGEVNANERLRWTAGDLISVSPFTSERLTDGATLLELAEATQKYGDNAAANILLRRLGGPQRLTRFWRDIGDQTSRLDRTEPSLNHVPVGEVRDTTSPQAMALTLEKLLFGAVLSPDRRALLRTWMAQTHTGAKRVRAGLPEGWAAGDKTGTSLWPGMGSQYVDIGFAVSPGGASHIFTAHYRARTTHDGIDPASEDVLRQVGQVLAQFAAS